MATAPSETRSTGFMVSNDIVQLAGKRVGDRQSTEIKYGSGSIERRRPVQLAFPLDMQIATSCWTIGFLRHPLTESLHTLVEGGLH